MHYLRAHDLTLTIPEGLSKDDFEKAKATTYSTAVKVWNALDASNRQRIRLPAKMDEDTINIPEQSELAKMQHDSQSDEDKESTTASSQ